MQFRTVLAIAASGLLAACALSPDVTPGLEGTRWQLVSVSGPDLPLPEHKPIAIGFYDSRVYFQACNALSGRYTQVRNQIAVPKGFIGTRMACEKSMMTVDAAATEMLQRGVNFSLKGDTLVLQSDGQRWSFERLPDVQQAPATTAATESGS